MRGEECVHDLQVFNHWFHLIMLLLFIVTEVSKRFFARRSIIKYQHQIILNTGCGSM